MELPHLRLYLRRMLASPKGLPFFEALRTARLRALTAVLGWVLATVLMQGLQLSGLSYLHSAYPNNRWAEDAPGLLYVLLTTLGVWAVLFLAADEMSTLAVQGRYGTPDWYSAPLESWRAVLATLLAALCACGPALLGLVLFVLLSGAWVEVHSLPLAPFQLPQLGQFALGLPGYCLASGLLALALRTSGFRPYLPLLLAGGGTLLGLTQYGVRALGQGKGDSWQQAQQAPGYFAAVLLGACAGALLVFWLLQLARQADASALSTATLFLLLGLSALPLLRAGVSASSQLGQWYAFFEGANDTYALGDDAPQLALRGLAAGVWPTSLAASYREDGANSYSWRNFGNSALTPAIPTTVLLRVRYPLWALSTLLWWLGTVAGLNAVRYPRRPSALKEAERQTAGVFA